MKLQLKLKRNRMQISGKHIKISIHEYDVGRKNKKNINLKRHLSMPLCLGMG
jgi:hypothetical protein